MTTALTPREIAEAYVDAYNASDLDGMAALYSPDVVVVHHNRGWEKVGVEAAMAGKRAAGTSVPDKRLADRRRLIATDDVAVIEHSWQGTAAQDLPGYAAKGEKIDLKLCTVFTIVDGKIARHDDYG
jgi:steroid delta-isomerase-like uncharacterized protein